MELDIAMAEPEISNKVSEPELFDEDSSDIIPKIKRNNNFKMTSNFESSDDDSTPVLKGKSRLKRFTDTESDTDKENYQETNNLLSDSDNEVKKASPSFSKKRITLKDNSDSDSGPDDKQVLKNEEQQLRMKNKRNKLRDKFKSLVTSRTKELYNDGDSDQNKNDASSNDSNDEEMSINNIKQNIKKSMSFKPAICDPDTSDDEGKEDRRERLVSKSPSQRKTKLTSPKPTRMSAKQAMENMKKIKSESNRLLREKEISLPYHRPKAISLKDIMSRRKAAVSADGKALPIKMNEEQLKQYVQMLEQRQKEIMELCKSESEEEQEECNTPDKNEDLKDSKNIENIVDEPVKDVMSELTNALVDNISVDEPLKDCISEITNDDEVNVVKEVPGGNGEQKSKEIPEPTEYKIVCDDNTELQKECSSDDTIVQSVVINTVNVETQPSDELGKDMTEDIVQQNMVILEQISKSATKQDSQNIQLIFDSENYLTNESDRKNNSEPEENNPYENDFSDDDINMEDIDKLIENAEIMNDESCNGNTKSLRLDVTAKPKLTGGPGAIIDLDDYDSDSSKKLSGVELLKERFTYFAKLKTPEELEREREKRLKPGAQHLKLKQELEEVIAEQRSIEWAKRLNEEKQQQMELKALRGEDSDAEDDIEKIEAKLEEKDEKEAEATSEEDEESELEEDTELTESKEKPRIKNPMLDDEAEESDCEEDDDDDDDDDKLSVINAEDNVANDNDRETSDESSEESSEDESEDEEQTKKTKKGRILKAFEDSDDENVDEKRKTDSILISLDKTSEKIEQNNVTDKVCNKNGGEVRNATCEMDVDTDGGSQIFKDSQDDEIQLAQRMVSTSDDLFTSQESASAAKDKPLCDNDESFVETQSFSILNANDSVKDSSSNLQNMDKLSFVTDSQSLDKNLETAVGLCSGTFSQNFIPSQLSSSQQPPGESQAIGEDVLALCTGNFYDNNFISQSEEGKADNAIPEAVNDNFDDSWLKDDSQGKESIVGDTVPTDNNELKDNATQPKNLLEDKDKIEVKGKQKSEDQNLLQSIIDELHDEEKETSKPNKYFPSNNMGQAKKKLIIESDEEVNEDTNEKPKKKKLKKRKLEQRALQISDDEEEEQSDGADEFMSDADDDAERIVDYDSEENEIEVKQLKPKKKHKATDFFENEAELTSEDEWVGSGDEDEQDLDRMEREEGDDDTFHEGKLQRKLGQIHMRDVLDQDKREVRLIQELLFEDGDLGDGHRQRKFRWKNADDVDDAGPVTDEYGTTQEEEFESEEQWRKQRHEREVFLRQMQEQDKKEDSPNISLNRTTMIKANLSSKPMSSMVMDVNKPMLKKLEKNEGNAEKSSKDIPSPRKGFTLLQQNYHSSLLTRGRGALARLAALATPLAIDEDSTKVAAVAPKNQRNFVFAAVTKQDEVPKVAKRKAENKLDTPRLVKKLKTKEKQTLSRNSLLDHLRV